MVVFAALVVVWMSEFVAQFVPVRVAADCWLCWRPVVDWVFLVRIVVFGDQWAGPVAQVVVQ